LSKTILAIDIGSTKICAIIAEMANDGVLSITGAGISKAQGLRRGSITNIEQASRSIKAALDDAKRISGSDAKRAVVSISGAYTKSVNSSGIVNIQNKEVNFKEIERVMQTALYNANIPHEYEILHALPYNFKVDDQNYIEDPLGMNASRLEVDVHIITTQKSSLNNLRKAINSTGIEIDSVVLSSYASSIAVLNDDEKELGVAVIDMGGSTCNIAIHSGNSLRYNDFLAVGSNHITSDLSMALHTPIGSADQVKLTYGSLLNSSNDLIELPVIGDDNNKQEVSLTVVRNVIYARVEETLMILAQFIENSGLKDKLGAGVVLTGGFSQLEGLRDLAVATFGSLPVRLAKPREMDGLFENLRSPEYSSAIGLLLYTINDYTNYEIDINKRVRHHSQQIAEPVEPINLAGDLAIPAVELGKDEQPQKMIELAKKKKKDEKDPNKQGGLSGFWNWATQLF
jgi:cell division protein FtsA